MCDMKWRCTVKVEKEKDRASNLIFRIKSTGIKPQKCSKCFICCCSVYDARNAWSTCVWKWTGDGGETCLTNTDAKTWQLQKHWEPDWKRKMFEHYYTSSVLYFHMKVSVFLRFCTQYCIIQAESVVMACLYHWVVYAPHCCNHYALLCCLCKNDMIIIIVEYCLDLYSKINQ